jgi:hypothetical protein
MKLHLNRLLRLMICACFFSGTFVFAKPIMVTTNGKMNPTDLNQIKNEVNTVKNNLSQDDYVAIVRNPQVARNDQERLAGLSAREIFVLVDRSGSMDSHDDNPTGGAVASWKRWDSARVATESVMELALSLDVNNKVDVMFWDGDVSGKLRCVKESITRVGQVHDLFSKYHPEGGTPLADALEELYSSNLHRLLQNSEPFTVLILTDGLPNDVSRVKQFFSKVVRDNRLEEQGRETLAAFSFIRMGDAPGAASFLKDLDDNLIQELKINVDIVDTKEDNFLFGSGKYAQQSGVGPLAVLWDAIYD